MKLRQEGWQVDRRVPLALILTLVAQAATAVWWASAKQQQDDFRDQKLSVLEREVERDGNAQAQILERLARIEERAAAQLEILRRMERGAR